MAGLVGGFTHCAGMCGPFVIAQAGSLGKISSSLLLPYHLGRMTTYVGLATLTNTVINLAFAVSPLKAMIASPMLALAGVIFLVNAFPQLNQVFPWVSKVRISLPYGLISASSKNLLRNPGMVKRYALGVLLGFIPALALTAAGGNIFKSMFPRISEYAFKGIMAFNGVWLIAMAGFLLV